MKRIGSPKHGNIRAFFAKCRGAKGVRKNSAVLWLFFMEGLPKDHLPPKSEHLSPKIDHHQQLVNIYPKSYHSLPKMVIYALLSSKCHESHLRAFVVKSTRVLWDFQGAIQHWERYLRIRWPWFEGALSDPLWVSAALINRSGGSIR